MKAITFLIMVTLTLSASAQSASGVVDAFFEALNSKDAHQLQDLCVDDMQLHSLKIGQETQLTSQGMDDFISSIQSIPEGTTIFEKIKSKESIVTEHLAQFTLAYSFYVEDKLSHSGTNVITLLKTQQGWKISYIADTRR